MKPRDAERSKNFFALGLISWLYTRPVEPTLDWIDQKFAKPRAGPRRQPRRVQGRVQLRRDRGAVRAPVRRSLRRGSRPGTTATSPATSRRPTGSSPRSQLSKLPIALRVVPDHAGVRHPARALAPQELRRAHAAGRGRDRRDRRGDRRRVRRAPRRSPRTSGPGVDLKSEAMGLAVSLELPLLIVDVQRGGPSTGLPTKTEQADLLLAMYGRHGEAPMPIVAASLAEPLLRRRDRSGAHRVEVPHAGACSSPTATSRTARSRGCCPTSTTLPDLSVPFATGAEPRRRRSGRTCAIPRRSRVRGRCPGTPGLMHRIGGIEKQDGTGNVNYDPENHEHMVAPAGREGRRHRRRHPRRRGRRSRRRRAARARVGEHVGRRAAGGAPGARTRAEGRARAPRCTSTRSRPTSARCWRGTRRCSCPR